jgi:hypothetical protein
MKMDRLRRSCFQVSIVGAVAEDGEKERLCGVGGRGKGGIFFLMARNQIYFMHYS